MNESDHACALGSLIIRDNTYITMVIVNKKHIAKGALSVALVALGTSGAVYAADWSDVRPNREVRQEEMRQEGDARPFGTHRGGGHLEVTAEVLGVSVDDLRVRLQSGETLKEILDSEGITPDDMRSAQEEQMRERLAQAVVSGKITQEEADVRTHEMAERYAMREAERIALENRDYDAWLTAATGTPLAEKVTRDNFDDFALAHELNAAGKHDEAHAIMESLGLDQGIRGHRPGRPDASDDDE